MNGRDGAGVAPEIVWPPESVAMALDQRYPVWPVEQVTARNERSCPGTGVETDAESDLELPDLDDGNYFCWLALLGED